MFSNLFSVKTLVKKYNRFKGNGKKLPVQTHLAIVEMEDGKIQRHKIFGAAEAMQAMMFLAANPKVKKYEVKKL